MKKYILSALIGFAFIGTAFSQDSLQVRKSNAANSPWRAYLNINLCTWTDQPDSISAKLFRSRGADIGLRYSFRFGKSRFGVTPGIGVSSYNLSSNAWVDTIGDTTVFRKQILSYKKNKFAINYVEVPLELYYESRNKNPLRIAIGFKGGYLMSSMSKFKNGDIKTKIYDLPNLSKYRYGATLSISYGWFGLTSFYSLSPAFDSNRGPQFIPITFGLTIAPY